VLDNLSWNLGNGKQINFWLDSWCGPPIASSLNIPSFISSNLIVKVSDFIPDHHWFFPTLVLHRFPNINLLIQHATIHVRDTNDKLLWKASSSGIITFKEDFLFKTTGGQHIGWAKKIWSPDIPLTKSMLGWRHMHDRFPIDNKL